MRIPLEVAHRCLYASRDVVFAKEMSPADVEEFKNGYAALKDAVNTISLCIDRLERNEGLKDQLARFANKEWFAKFGYKLQVIPKIKLLSKAVQKLEKALYAAEEESMDDAMELFSIKPESWNIPQNKFVNLE